MTTCIPQAIETHYASHRFRSRTEARWAVAFDALGEPWLYEPQGYDLTLLRDRGHCCYLPDFYLPNRRLWVEVKGSHESLKRDWPTLLTAAHPTQGLPLDPDGSPVPEGGTFPRLMVLGPVPEGFVEPWARAGFLLFSMYEGRRAFQYSDLLGNTTLPLTYFPAEEGATRPLCTYSLSTPDLHIHRSDDRLCREESDRINHALTSAREARFEFGERPYVVPWSAGEPAPRMSP
jgi:hypothetical protein